MSIENEIRKTLAAPPPRCANCGWKESDGPAPGASIAFYSVQVHGPRNCMGAASIPLCNRCAWLMRDEVLNAVGKFTKETAERVIKPVGRPLMDVFADELTPVGPTRDER
jgi:hypothetical protein